VDLCTGNEHKHKFILEGAVSHLGRLCSSSSALVRYGCAGTTLPSFYALRLQMRAQEGRLQRPSYCQVKPLHNRTSALSSYICKCDQRSCATFFNHYSPGLSLWILKHSSLLRISPVFVSQKTAAIDSVEYAFARAICNIYLDSGGRQVTGHVDFTRDSGHLSVRHASA
jgi:hypothetical protein